MINIDKTREKKSIKELLEFSIININKPTGPTSFSVSQYVKNALGLKKTAHLGTLDPAVTGVLPVALNRACRLNEYLMHRNKVYVGIMRLHSDVDDKKLDEVIKKFLGKIKQLPPVRSRVKRAVREREIKKLEILEREDKDVLFLADVQAGTYIRKLCDDIGKEIGGAHMLELRRTRAGIFDETKSVNLYEFDKAVSAWKNGDESALRAILIPAEIVSELLPVIELKKEHLKKYLNGSPILKDYLEKKFELIEGEKVCAFLEDRFIGCYKVHEDVDIVAVPEFVLTEN